MENQKFKVKIIGILFNPEERKILVGKNKEDSKFSFLEGYLKYDEELDEGLKKATSEKTGYTIHNLGVIYARNNIKNRKETIELYFLCEATEGSEILGKNVKEIKWIKPSEYESLTEEKLPSRLREYILNLEWKYEIKVFSK